MGHIGNWIHRSTGSIGKEGNQAGDINLGVIRIWVNVRPQEMRKLSRETLRIEKNEGQN